MGMGGLFRIGGDGPCLSKFPRAGNSPLGAQLLYAPGGEIPFFGGLPHSHIVHRNLQK